MKQVNQILKAESRSSLHTSHKDIMKLKEVADIHYENLYKILTPEQRNQLDKTIDAFIVFDRAYLASLK